MENNYTNVNFIKIRLNKFLEADVPVIENEVFGTVPPLVLLADVPEWPNGIDSRHLSDECSSECND